MRFGPANFGCGACAVLLVFGCGALAPDLRAQGMQRSTRSAASSETNSVEIFSTLKGLDEKDDGMRRLDEELTKSLQPFINREPVPSPVSSTYPASRLPVAKKLLSKEELEKSRGWIWDTDEAVSGRSEEEKSMFPGFSSNTGSDKKKSAWDSKKSRPQPLSSSDYQSRDEPEAKSKTDSDDGADFSGGLGTAAKRLKAHLETESVGSIFRSSSAHGSVGDFFGQPTVTPTAAQIQAHKDYMDEYQKIIGGSIIAGSVLDSRNPAFQSTAAPVFPGNSAGLDILPSSSRNDAVAVSSGLIPSAPTPATVPDANANILNQWNPLYSPPKTELAKPAPFFPPPMEFPRRKF